jgi:hypothetical protein
METALLLTRRQSRYHRRLARRRHRFAKRLRFLLLGLKIVNALGPPIEKLMIALIQECISQIWPEPTVESMRLDPMSQKRTNLVRVGDRPGPIKCLVAQLLSHSLASIRRICAICGSLIFGSRFRGRSLVAEAEKSFDLMKPIPDDVMMRRR